jgi:hypothetical protein
VPTNSLSSLTVGEKKKEKMEKKMRRNETKSREVMERVAKKRR